MFMAGRNKHRHITQLIKNVHTISIIAKIEIKNNSIDECNSIKPFQLVNHNKFIHVKKKIRSPYALFSNG